MKRNGSSAAMVFPHEMISKYLSFNCSKMGESRKWDSFDPE